MAHHDVPRNNALLFIDRWVYLVTCVSRPGKAEKRAKLGWPDVVRLLSLRKLYVRLYTARARHQVMMKAWLVI